jgi:hypothetical protein
MSLQGVLIRVRYWFRVDNVFTHYIWNTAWRSAFNCIHNLVQWCSQDVPNVAHGRNCCLSLTPTAVVPSSTRSRQHSDLEDQNERRKKRTVLCFVYSFFEKCFQVWEPVCELHDPTGRNPSRHLARMICVLWLVSTFYPTVSRPHGILF